MGASENGMKEPSGDSARIKSDIGDTRVHMDHLLGELEERLQPRHLVEDAIHLVTSVDYGKGTDKAKEGGRALLSHAYRSIKRHPLPSAFIGGGIIWLVAQESTDGGGSGEAKVHLQDGKSRLMAGTERLKARFRERRHEAGVRSKASMRKARAGSRRQLESNPLGYGLAALAAGAAMAMLAPSTQKERETLGPYSQDARRKTKAAAGGAQEMAGRIAEGAIKGAQQELEQEDWSARPQTPQDKNAEKASAEYARQERGDL